MRGVVICGGRRVESTIVVVGKGFERLGYRVAYLPTRNYAVSTSTSKFSPIDDIDDKLVAAVESVEAELIVWVMCKADYPAGLSARIRQSLPNVRWGYHSFDDPFVVDTGEFERSREFDFAITCCQGSVPDYERLGVPAICLYPPFDDDLHTNIDSNTSAATDISFIATNIYPPSRFKHSLYSRADIVRAVAPLGTLSLYGPWANRYNWGGEHGVPELKELWRGALRYEQLGPVYKASRINLNSHVRPDGYRYLNERFTNVLGAGGFMLVDAVNGIDEFQRQNDGIVPFEIYRNLDDLVDKVRFYLANEGARAAVAASGLRLAKSMFSNTIFAEKTLLFSRAL